MRLFKERAVKLLLFGCAFLAASVLIGILALLLLYGGRAFKEINPLKFLLGTVWNPDAYGEPKYGMVPLAVGSLFTTILALAIAAPTGIASALFISERLKGRVRTFVRTLIEILAGFPSVVIGFFGLTVISPLIARIFNVYSGLNLLNGGVLLGVMALPTIISISEDALRAVPMSYREAALALGADEWLASVKVVLPAARPGIIAALMLGFGRAIGETMAVLMVSGNAPIIPLSPFDPVRTITSTIAIELGEVPFGTTHFYALFALGLLLFIIALTINLIAESMLKRERMRFQI
ncbi:TPA: phosphate ABC transporter permease subunit PstC [Candidatus Poribacteria bacterium]|nr:phosphate ABC transporter permease subunit PstC [Candidatus Poribacteria bacterium]